MSTGHPLSHNPAAPAQNPADVLDIREYGLPKDGVPQVTERRLYCQLQVFTGCPAPEKLIKAVEASGLEAALYLDVNDPQGVGLLTLTEDPAVFVGSLRHLLNTEPFISLERRPEMTMLGRTYATGYEPDLRFWLLKRPVETVCNESWPWAVWYPLRRSGAFNRLEGREQAAILKEHGLIGRAYGAQDLAHDVRLACHGLDARDNEFVIGLIGKQLHPLSHVVQAMRKTRQTAEFIAQMGPFFVGHVARRLP